MPLTDNELLALRRIWDNVDRNKAALLREVKRSEKEQAAKSPGRPEEFGIDIDPHLAMIEVGCQFFERYGLSRNAFLKILADRAHKAGHGKSEYAVRCRLLAHTPNPLIAFLQKRGAFGHYRYPYALPQTNDV